MLDACSPSNQSTAPLCVHAYQIESQVDCIGEIHKQFL